MSVNDQFQDFDTVPSESVSELLTPVDSNDGESDPNANRSVDERPLESEIGTDSSPTEAIPPEELAAMAAALERFHGRAEEYESIIRRMQTRIEELQANQVRELLKPVIIKLASLHTEAVAAEGRAAARDDDSARKDFDFFVVDIEESLGLLDVESIGVSVGDEFDASKHAARRRIDTDDPSLDRRIAKVVRQGFTFVGAERVFLPAMVNVHRYSAPEGVDPGVSATSVDAK